MITNNSKFILAIDGQTERDEEHNAMIWGGACYAYQHLAYILKHGMAKKSIQIIDVDTKDIIVSVDIKKVIEA